MSELSDYILSELESTKKQIDNLSKNLKEMLNAVPQKKPRPFMTAYDVIQDITELPANAEIRFIVNGTGRAYNLSTDEPNQRFDMDDIETVLAHFYVKDGIGYFDVTLED